MTSTYIGLFIIIVLIIVAISILINAAILMGLSRLFKIMGATYKKSLAVIGAIALISLVLYALFWLIGVQGLLANILSWLILYFVFNYFYRKHYLTSWKKSLGLYAVQTLVNIIIGIVLGLAIALPVRMLIAEPIVVSGQSMSPHYTQGDYLFINKTDKNFLRDDVIVFNFMNKTIIKRIIGLPSETVSIKNDQLFINGEKLNDTNLYGLLGKDLTMTLGTDEYFVLGDNLASSTIDSRDIGPIKTSQIEGKATNK